MHDFPDSCTQELPLALRLHPDTPVSPNGRAPDLVGRDDLDRFLLAKRPAPMELRHVLEELPPDTGYSEHPSRWYARITTSGNEVPSWIRGHIQIKEGAPRVVVEHAPEGARGAGPFVSVGLPGRVHSPHFVYPIPETKRSSVIAIDGVPSVRLLMTGWFGDGVDLILRRVAGGTLLHMDFFPLQVGRPFLSPDTGDHFSVCTCDLPVYNPLRG